LIRARDIRNGKLCERRMVNDAKSNGYDVVKIPFGADFIEMRPRQKPRFVEVKYGCGPISKTQEKTKKFVESLGMKYDVRRCACDL